MTRAELNEIEAFNNSDEQCGGDFLESPTEFYGQLDKQQATAAHKLEVATFLEKVPVGQVEPVTLSGSTTRLTGAEADALCLKAQERETLLHGEHWGVIRGLFPDLSKCAREAFSLFNGMQQMYMPIWNPRCYKETLEAKIAQCVDTDEFIKLNAQLLACNTTTPDVERRLASLWNEKVHSHWYPTLHTFRSLARKKIDDKLADVKDRETLWLLKEFGLPWSPTPATRRMQEIKTRFEAFERNATEHLSNPARQIGGSRLDLVGAYEMIGDDVYNGSILYNPADILNPADI